MLLNIRLRFYSIYVILILVSYNNYTTLFMHTLRKVSLKGQGVNIFMPHLWIIDSKQIKLQLLIQYKSQPINEQHFCTSTFVLYKIHVHTYIRIARNRVRAIFPKILFFNFVKCSVHNNESTLWNRSRSRITAISAHRSMTLSHCSSPLVALKSLFLRTGRKEQSCNYERSATPENYAYTGIPFSLKDRCTTGPPYGNRAS